MCIRDRHFDDAEGSLVVEFGRASILDVSSGVNATAVRVATAGIAVATRTAVAFTQEETSRIEARPNSTTSEPSASSKCWMDQGCKTIKRISASQEAAVSMVALFRSETIRM